MLDRMVGFAGTSDLGGIGEATLQKWIGSLLKTMGNNTVGRVHLAAAKRIFGFARARRLIPLDPTCELSVDTGRQYGGRTRGYSDDEAALILAACREPPPRPRVGRAPGGATLGLLALRLHGGPHERDDTTTPL